MKTINNIRLPKISGLPLNLWLLLKKICNIEKLSCEQILDLISSHQNIDARLDQVVALFCANYFAQASTLAGHKAAGHGSGNTSDSVKAVFNCVVKTDRVLPFSELPENHRFLSEDIKIYLS